MLVSLLFFHILKNLLKKFIQIFFFFEFFICNIDLFSLSTTLCLLYKPQVIAIAVLLLAFKMSNQNIRDFISKPRVDWWKTFHVDATEADLEGIFLLLVFLEIDQFKMFFHVI